MSWELDGRKGTATIGNATLDGFARMRDCAKHLIAFHVPAHDIFSGSRQGPSTTEQFLIDEDVFEPTATLSPASESY